MNSLVNCPILLILLLLTAQNGFAAQDYRTTAEIRKILQERIDQHHKSVGMVVGVVSEEGSKIVGYGKLTQDRSQIPDGDTVFEIGSITKVFTSLLLADMVEHGEVNLNDPITKFLPQSVKVPTKNGREIRLFDLATQTSGLPRLPDNLAPKDTSNPYADYTVEQMYAFLSSYVLTRDIGAT